MEVFNVFTVIGITTVVVLALIGLAVVIASVSSK